MRNILIILAALLGIGAFGQTNIPTRQMMADTNGVVKWPTNITSITIGGRTYTNLLGFGLALTNGQLSIDTTQLPSGGGSGTVTSVGLSTSLSGLSIGSTPVTSSGTITLSGTLGVASGGTGATDAAGGLAALGGQASDSDLSALASAGSTGTGAFVRADSPTLSGTWAFDALGITTLTVSSNLYVPDVAYDASWNGRTNAPTMNAVYDQMELRAMKPIAITSAYASTVTPSIGTAGANLVLNIGALTNNITVDNPSGTPTDGQLITLRMKQNATGGFSVAWGTNYTFGTDATAALIPTAASASWRMLWEYNSTEGRWEAMAIARGF